MISLYRLDDPALQAAKQNTATLLYGTTDADVEQLAAGAAAWALVHGITTLWLNGNLPSGLGDDPEAITRLVASHLHIPDRRGAAQQRTLDNATGARRRGARR